MDPTTPAIERDLLQRTPGLGAWRRRPWVWFGVALLLLGLLDGVLIGGNADDLSTYRQADVVSATVLPSWDGDAAVPVRYRNPSTGHIRDVVVPQDNPAVRRIGPVRLHISPGHPDEGRVVGSRQVAHVVNDQSIQIAGSVDATSSWLGFVILTAIILAGFALWAWRRHRRVRAAAQLLASLPVATPLVAVPRPGWLFARHWRLDLFPVGAGLGDRSVGRVRVAPNAGEDGPRPIELLGDGDRWRRQVLREPATGITWVPVGRPLRRHVEFGPRREHALDGWRPIGLVLIALGIAMIVVGASHDRDRIGELNGRSRPVVVTLQRAVPAGGGEVPVTYTFDGQARESSSSFGGPQARGARVLRRIDPVRPTVLWQDGANSPPTDGTNLRWDLSQVAGGFVIFGGLFLLRRPRTREEAGRPAWGAPGPSWAPAPRTQPLAPGWAAPTAPPPMHPPGMRLPGTLSLPDRAERIGGAESEGLGPDQGRGVDHRP